MSIKIIAGRFRGQKIAVPSTHTRPTASLVREAIFSMLGQKVEGALVLDLYAGSGAMGLEALSRGARHTIFCDEAPAALATIRENLIRPGLCDTEHEILKARWPRDFYKLGSRGPFDLIFIDPPYQDGQNPLAFLRQAATGLAASGALTVWEQSPPNLKTWTTDEISPWRLVKTRSWGERAVALLEFDSEVLENTDKNRIEQEMEGKDF